MPWSREGLGFPVNPTTSKHYRDGNVMALLGSRLPGGPGNLMVVVLCLGCLVGQARGC